LAAVGGGVGWGGGGGGAGAVVVVVGGAVVVVVVVVVVTSSGALPMVRTHWKSRPQAERASAATIRRASTPSPLGLRLPTLDTSS
jgi:hypothetical protein